MPGRLIHLVMLTTVVLSVSSARAQDATTPNTRPFSAGAFFTGVFHAEAEGEVGVMFGGLGYVARRRMLLGAQGGLLGAGTVNLGIYGLADVGYFLRIRTGHQIYALGGLGGYVVPKRITSRRGLINVPTRSLLFNVGAGLDFLVFPKVGRPRQEGYAFGARIGSLISDGGEVVGLYVQLALFGGGRRTRP